MCNIKIIIFLLLIVIVCGASISGCNEQQKIKTGTDKVIKIKMLLSKNIWYQQGDNIYSWKYDEMGNLRINKKEGNRIQFNGLRLKYSSPRDKNLEYEIILPDTLIWKFNNNIIAKFRISDINNDRLIIFTLNALDNGNIDTFYHFSKNNQ